jgi:hypothetical protein
MWVFGRVEVENPPPIMRNNEEAIENADSADSSDGFDGRSDFRPGTGPESALLGEQPSHFRSVEYCLKAAV